MNVLLINQFFWPDTAATAQLLSDLTREIDPGLHAVTVLCGTSLYGEVDSVSAPPAKVVQCGRAAFSRGKFGRITSYASFFAAAAVRGVRETNATLVVTLTTPPLISLLGTFLKTVRGSRHFIWEMDLYPDIAVDLNVLKRASPLTWAIRVVADFSRKRADGIIVLDDDMKRRLTTRGIPENKIFVAENWADGQEIRAVPFSAGPLVVQYSGTLGLAHDESTIFEVMRQLRNDGRFRFEFVGGGAKRPAFEQTCRLEGINAVAFRDYARRSDLGLSLGSGHIGLVTQLPQTVGAVVPSKTYGIMAAARPVLYVGPRNSATARMLERNACGWQVDPGDAPTMIRLLERLETDRDLLQAAGANARSTFQKYYDRPTGASRILSILGLSETPRILAADVMTARAPS